MNVEINNYGESRVNTGKSGSACPMAAKYGGW